MLRERKEFHAAIAARKKGVSRGFRCEKEKSVTRVRCEKRKRVSRGVRCEKERSFRLRCEKERSISRCSRCEKERSISRGVRCEKEKEFHAGSASRKKRAFHAVCGARKTEHFMRRSLRERKEFHAAICEKERSVSRGFRYEKDRDLHAACAARKTEHFRRRALRERQSISRGGRCEKEKTLKQSKKMLIDIIAGARPNFMKIAPIIEAIKKASGLGRNIDYRLIHTGQHYDKNMSDNFFEQLSIPEPEINLEAGGGTQAEQTANIMVRYEKVLFEKKPAVTLVVGDVTSTMACSIAAKKLQVKVAHVEAGIRSFDLSMPEEINRMVTDAITDYYFTTSEVANKNLIKCGVGESRIFFVGNTMIDTLLNNLNKLRKPAIWDRAGLKEKEYIIVTLHRPANVDGEDKLKALLMSIIKNVNGLPVVFPVHPRTAKIIAALEVTAPNLHIIEPMGYLEFNFLVKNAKGVITDSGGITEETTVMGVPCMTLRDNTERPETVTEGSNELLGTDPNALKPALDKLFAGQWKKGGIPNLWDGKTGERIVEVLLKVVKTV